jgi:3-hydroxybutyryl-CoA dehydrogenase
MGDIRSIGVVGAGQMGAGIAQVAAASGVRVVLRDLHLEVVDRALQGIGRQLEKLVEKGKLTADDRAATLSRIKGTASLADFADVDVVIEAVTENEELKKKILVELDGAMKEGAILATNTSSISITRLAAAVKRPERFIGMHFMNPVPVMKLVEIIPGLKTSELTLAETRTLAERLGKTTVRSDDQPGFIVNRILVPMINEAVIGLAEGLGTPEDIDTAMKLGTNQPMGPLALADLIGLDTCLSIMEVLHSNLGDPKYRPAPLLRRYVAAGWLGKKAGRGFYRYDTPA